MRRQIYLCLAILSVGCTTTRITPVGGDDQVTIRAENDSSSVTIFLLERDIPAEIKRLGIVTIAPNTPQGSLSATDLQIKKKLTEACQKMGANGAYRVHEGTYQPNIVSYLIFRYDQ